MEGYEPLKREGHDFGQKAHLLSYIGVVLILGRYLNLGYVVVVSSAQIVMYTFIMRLCNQVLVPTLLFVVGVLNVCTLPTAYPHYVVYGVATNYGQ